MNISPNMTNLIKIRHRLDEMATAMQPIDHPAARYLTVTVVSIDNGIADLQRARTPAYDASFEVIRHLWARAKRDADDDAPEGEAAAASFLRETLWLSMKNSQLEQREDES